MEKERLILTYARIENETYVIQLSLFTVTHSSFNKLRYLEKRYVHPSGGQHETVLNDSAWITRKHLPITRLTSVFSIPSFEIIDNNDNSRKLYS